MTFVAYVQSIDQASRSGVSALNIEQQLHHATVTRRGVTDEIEKAALELSRDVQQCSRQLVDKAATMAGVSRSWAMQVTMHASYEGALAAGDDDDGDDEDFQPEKAPVRFLVDTIGTMAAGSPPEAVAGLFGVHHTGEAPGKDKVDLFASGLLSLCRDEKKRRSQPVSVALTTCIGGPKTLAQVKGNLTAESFDIEHLVSSFGSDKWQPPPDGCDRATIRARGNGKYTISTKAPPSLEAAANDYLGSVAETLQEEWLRSAASASCREAPGPDKAQPTTTKTVPPPSDLLSMQPSLNIGVIGDVANGKSTLVKAISGKRTQQHSKEQQKHGITIRLGFANAAVLKCQNEAGACGAYSFLPESEDSGDPSRLPTCTKCNAVQKVVKRFSLIDCPGHAELMATMLAGASAFDAVLLAAAANVPCPTPQARQHLEAIKLSGAMDGNTPRIAIAQTKAELLADESKNAASRLSPEERLEHHAEQGRGNLTGTVAQTAPIFPVCAPLDLGLEAIAEWIADIPPKEPDPEGRSAPCRLSILRSFDVNRTNTLAREIEGGVLGGTIVGGDVPFCVGDLLEVRPGLCLSSANPSDQSPPPPKALSSSKWKKTPGSSKPKKSGKSDGPSKTPFRVQPLRFRCTSLMTGKNPLSTAGKGGLVAVGTSLDPAMCADNRMVGAVSGRPGSLPPVWGPAVYLDGLEFVELVPDFGRDDDAIKPVDVLVKGASVRCHLGSSTINGRIVRLSKSARKLEICLDGPVCAPKGANVAIEAKGRNGFVLVAHTKLFGGDVALEGADQAGGQLVKEEHEDKHDHMDEHEAKLAERDEEHRQRFMEDLQCRKEEDTTGAGGVSARVSVPLPDIARDGGAHVVLSNFGLMAHALRRDPDHWMAYLQKEGGLSCVLAGERSSPATTALRVRWRGGRNFAERFTSIMRKYIRAFVTCQECRSAVTELNAAKNEILCRRCNARRFVDKL